MTITIHSGLIYTIVIGFLVGLVARFFYPGRDPMGFIFTTLLGIGGSVLGSWAGQTLGWYGPGQPAGWIVSTIAAVAILAVYSRMTGKR